MSTAYSVCAYTHKTQTGRYNRNFQKESFAGFTSYENIQTQRFGYVYKINIETLANEICNR